jgi:plasmid stabilization system protein ParE
VTARQVRFTRTAREQLRIADAWWRANRDHPNALRDELRTAVALIAAQPGVGTPYHHPRLAGLKRVYLRTSGLHMYYVSSTDEVVIHALWHARRGTGPVISR